MRSLSFSYLAVHTKFHVLNFHVLNERIVSDSGAHLMLASCRK